MKLRSLVFERLEIPLRVEFQHATARRRTSCSVLVRAASRAGIEGRGEGCPRPYVTGETLASAEAFFMTYRDEWLLIDNLGDLRDWQMSHRAEIDSNPAAFCAVEMALLGVLAREGGISIEGLLGLPAPGGRYLYSGIIGTSQSQCFDRLLAQYLEQEFLDLKIKLFADEPVDERAVKAINKQGGHTLHVRYDANNGWTRADAFVKFARSVGLRAFAIEEPLGVGNYEGFRQVARALDTRIVLDESFLRQADFGALGSDLDCWIINLRVSKMGGVLRSLDIAAGAARLGVPVIVGAHVGETSLLSRAALAVATACGTNLLAREGAFGTRLLSRDVTEPPVMFGQGGALAADGLPPVW